MDDKRVGPSGEWWHIETPRERHERRRRYKEAALRRSRWLFVTAVLLIGGGVAGMYLALVLGQAWAFCLLLLVPVGVLRLISALFAPGDPCRRALYAHPILKFFALLFVVAPLAGPCARPQDAKPQPRVAPEAAPPGDGAETDEKPQGARARAETVLGFLVCLMAGIVLFVVSLDPRRRGSPF